MDKNTMTQLAQIYNSLRMTHPTQDDILIIADAMRGIYSILQSASKDSTTQEGDEPGGMHFGE